MAELRKTKQKIKEDAEQIVFNSLKTKRNANQFILLSGALLRRSGEMDIDKVLTDVFGEIRPSWMEDLIKNVPGLQTGILSDSDINILKAIRHRINDAIEVKVDMSFEPSEYFIDSVINIMKDVLKGANKGSYNVDLIVDVNVKEDFEPGAIFYVNGHVIDLRVRNKVINYLYSQDVVNRYL